MPTNRELQDRIDELALEVERLSDDAAEAPVLREEVIALRGELAQSEESSRHLQGMVTALTSGQQSLSEINEEKQQILLARVSAASRQMAEAGARWTDEKKGLVSEGRRKDTQIEELTRRNTERERLLADREERLETASTALASWDRISKGQQAEVGSLRNELAKAHDTIRKLRERPPRTFWAEMGQGIVENPGCVFWLGLTLMVIIALGFLIQSWIWPSTPPPPRGLGM